MLLRRSNKAGPPWGNGMKAVPAPSSASPMAMIGAREAELILGISRASVHRLVATKRLRGRQSANPRRVWLFRRQDVLDLKDSGTALERGPVRPRIRIGWCHWFGPIPPGLTVIARDGDHRNVCPSNLALVPIAARVKKVEARTIQRNDSRIWTPADREYLREKFSRSSTADIAEHFAVTVQAIRCQARKLGLRKDAEYIRAQARITRALPIGTERIDPSCDIVVVKVAMTGTWQQQWRRKHHLAWESANGKPVPSGFRVIFKDGNKRNFDPANLALATKEEISAVAFTNYLAYPSALRDAIKLHRKLEEDIRHRYQETPEQPRRTDAKRKPRNQRRWTPAMDAVFCAEYPRMALSQLAQKLGVTIKSLRVRARRLGVRRLPEVTIAEARAKAETQKAILGVR